MLLVLLVSAVAVLLVVHFMLLLLIAVAYDPVRNVAARTYFCFCSNGGSSYSHGATNTGGVRSMVVT